MRKGSDKKCCVCGATHYAKGYCKLHYCRIKHNRNLTMPLRKQKNEYFIDGDIATFTVYNIEHFPIGYFKVDAEDVPKVTQLKWSFLSTGYIVAYADSKTILLHRYIMDCPNDLVVDHLNHDKTDNRKCNLRVCTQLENNRNLKRVPKYITKLYRNQNVYYSVQIRGKYMGCFKNEKDAQKCVDTYR